MRREDDPRRRCMPLGEWPSLDGQAWGTAIRTADVLGEQGLAAHWRPKTQRSVVAAYGRYLTFLERTGELDRKAGPENRLSKERLRGFIAELEETVSSVTLAGRLRNLVEALRVMVPGACYPYLNLARRRAKARQRSSRNKKARIVHSRVLFELGLSLMRRAESDQFGWAILSSCLYRDGLIILILACRPIRLANMTGLRIGVDFLKTGDSYQIALRGTDTKNHRPYDRPLDAMLTPYIDRYLDMYRPKLLGTSESQHMWISHTGNPITDRNLYGQITLHTKKAFGQPLCPHLFRDCAATSLGEENPEHAWLSMSLLHHADPRITEKHYDQATAIDAVRKYQREISAQRNRISVALPRVRRG